MNGKPVTDEIVATWKRLRAEGKSYAKIAGLTGYCDETVRRHAKDGRSLKGGRPPAEPELLAECGGDMKEYNRRRKRKAPKEKKQPGRKIEYPELLEEVGGDMVEYQRRRKQLNNANRARSKKQKAKVYDSEKKWDSKWKAAGAPPPRYGRSCTCPVPLLDDDDYCRWCGRLGPCAKTIGAASLIASSPTANVTVAAGRQPRSRQGTVPAQTRGNTLAT